MMKNIFHIQNCYGCGVCATVCPKNIISIKLNRNGFYEPYIKDLHLCNNCGLCISVCSFIDKKTINHDMVPLHCYAAWSNDEQIHGRCSSGGIGFEIGKQLLKQGYKACGVKYNTEKVRAEHYISTNVNEPLFIWGVTMQNHTPYSVANYTDELEIQVSDGIVSEKAKDTLTAYVNGLNNSDKAIQKLIDYLEKNETPTILVFFGDHLPSLYDAYLDSGFIHTRDTTKWNSEEMLKLHTVPFFIYDNYKYKQEYSNDEIVGNVFLGNYLCNYIGLEKSMYFKYLDMLNFNAIRDRLFVDKNMNAFEKVTDEYKEIINDHKILQYDILYGEKYIDEYSKEKTKE